MSPSSTPTSTPWLQRLAHALSVIAEALEIFQVPDPVQAQRFRDHFERAPLGRWAAIQPSPPSSSPHAPSLSPPMATRSTPFVEPTFFGLSLAEVTPGGRGDAIY